MTALPRNWSEIVADNVDNSKSIAIGVFSTSGETLFTNLGMRSLLGDEQKDESPTAIFVNPNFKELCSNGDSGIIFHGLMTVGDSYRTNRSLNAQVWKEGDELLITGELDALELDDMNFQLSRTNQKINNLQRELLKKNMLLEEALEQLKRTQSQLLHSEKMNALGQLVAGVAHEIRNPLGFIMANLQTLEENFYDLNAAYTDLETKYNGEAQLAVVNSIRSKHYLDEIQQELPDSFKSILDGLKRIDKIVDSFRTFSRLDEASVKTVSIIENLQSTLVLVRSKLEKQQIHVDLDDQLAQLPAIECYPAELNQVFMNLILNAYQAMPTGGIINFTGKQIDEEWIELTICDNGEGINPDVINKIFDPFFTTKPVGSGTGLGLTIVHEIITGQHGGKIAATSEPNKGSCFQLTLKRRLDHGHSTDK